MALTTFANFSFKLFAVILGVIGFWHVYETRQGQSIKPHSIAVSPGFDWNTLAPTDDLSKWVDCYQNRHCARLRVPLNYSEPHGKSATIAVVRVPSPLRTTSKYRGPVLINPGGPGGSGIDAIAHGRGDNLAIMLGPQFDIVGFDPRGVGKSTPKVSFFKTEAERALWHSPSSGVLQWNSTDNSIAYAHARALTTSRLAGERDDGYLAHIHTDNTARDMLRITEAHGRKKLQYWGFSYGSVLGATFAAMFPDKVERLVIDGVVDSENYYATLWSNNLLDTDKTLQTFFDGCYKAGPDRCAFYASSPAAIAQNLTNLYESIKAHPITARSNTSYGIVDYAGLKRTVFTTLYSPVGGFASLAKALSHLDAGNGDLLLEIMQQSEGPPFECFCTPHDGWDDYDDSDANTAIKCTDGAEVNDSLEELRDHYRNTSKLSSFAEVWSSHLACAGWPIQHDDHFTGPFVANTSHPLLLVGNTADPVTPLWAAHKMSKGFSGSVVLTQDSPGHCSYAAPSLCTQKHIRNYFQNGVLPPVGTVCSVEGELFPHTSESRGSVSGLPQATLESMSADDRELFEAIDAMSRARGFGSHSLF